MPYKILEHTADLRINVKGSTLENLFMEAFNALMRIMKGKPESENSRIKRAIKISALDKTSLLVDFLNEILSLSQIHKELYDNCVIKNLSENFLEAQITGFPAKRFNKDIKAVTYHEANIKRNKGGLWETNLVFDI